MWAFNLQSLVKLLLNVEDRAESFLLLVLDSLSDGLSPIDCVRSVMVLWSLIGVVGLFFGLFMVVCKSFSRIDVMVQRSQQNSYKIP